MSPLTQGDIIELSGSKYPVLVLSKEAFNESGLIIGCPLMSVKEGPLHINIHDDIYAVGELLRSINLQPEYYSVKDHINFEKCQDISYRIQSIFDYI